jgi:hypothetical protein
MDPAVKSVLKQVTDSVGCLGLLCVLAALGGAALGLLMAYPGPTLIIGGALIAIGWFIFSVSVEKDRLAASERERASAAESASQRERKQQADERRATKRVNVLCNSLTSADCLIIDSNIWMNEEYDALFVCLRESTLKSKKTIVVFGPQFDEICNLKRTTSYKDESNQRARLAINRIEKLQKERLLRIEPVTIEAVKGAYADPLIVQLLISEAQNARSICFVSDDKELRVRVREHLRHLPRGRAKIVEIQDFEKELSTVASMKETAT